MKMAASCQTICLLTITSNVYKQENNFEKLLGQVFKNAYCNRFNLLQVCPSMPCNCCVMSGYLYLL